MQEIKTVANRHWNSFLTFYEVYTLGSFAKAAKQLNMTQPAVSKHILKIENAYKLQLFERNTNKISPTPHADDLYKVVKELLSRLNEIEKKFQEGNPKREETLKIITAAGLAENWLPPLFMEYNKKHPNIRLSISGTDEDIDFNTQDFDIIIRKKLENNNFNNIYWRDFEIGLFASPGYLKKHGCPQVPEDLDKHKLIALKKVNSFILGDMDWHLMLGREKRRLPNLEFCTSKLLINAACNDLGIIAMTVDHPQIKNRGLVPILQQYPNKKVQTYLSVQKRLMDVPKIKKMIAIFRKNTQEREKTSK